MSFNITPAASEYQEIHHYGVVNIDSVKINTSLIMIREWEYRSGFMEIKIRSGTLLTTKSVGGQPGGQMNGA